jgi:hypothetical protein
MVEWLTLLPTMQEVLGLIPGAGMGLEEKDPCSLQSIREDVKLLSLVYSGEVNDPCG